MPPPPPPSAPAFKPPPKTAGRGDLLNSIEGFKKGGLKKAQTVDKSGPAVAKPSSSGGVSSGASAGASGGGGGASFSGSPAPMAMGGIFAGGGIPKLRKTGLPGSSTMLAKKDEPAPSVATSQPAVPPAGFDPSRAALSSNASAPIQRATPPVKATPTPPAKATPTPPTKATPPAPSPRSSQGPDLAVASYSYEAQRKTDISLQPEDLVRITNRHPPMSGNGNWWEGMLLHSGQSGHFPHNYVRVLTVQETRTVKHNYQAQRNDELSLAKGQTVQVYLQRDSGWWLGACGDEFGLFPENHTA